MFDVVREWLREYLQRKHSMYEKRFCSPAFGAGFYGMELSASEKMLQLMDAEKIGVSWDGGKNETTNECGRCVPD